MTPPADPYRTLGLARGSSLAEVKRAYRALAKVNHPDAAGPGALPRFLAIQTAYEQILRSAPTSTGGSRGAAKPPSRPAEADPDRADATHRAYSGRTRRTKTTGSRPRREPGPDPSPGRTATGDDRDGQNKATLGSTSYDGAAGQPFEPDWAGASWYGTTSGTYWTINPKEYADPRKHGPEYQARARRAARTRAAGVDAGAAASLGGTPDPATADADPDATADPTDATGGASGTGAGTSTAPGGPAHTTTSWWDSTSAADGAPAGTRSPDGRYPGAGAAAAAATAASRSSRATVDADVPPPDLAAAATDLGRALTDERTARGRWRLVQALVGWLPIVLGLDWLVGEITGCGRYAASCTGAQSLITPLLALAVLALLLLVPMLASIAATAAVAAVVAAIPTALVLSASGGAFEGAPRAAFLGFVLLVAWVAGVVFAIVRRVRRRSMPSG
jgi:hypothetical protein